MHKLKNSKKEELSKFIDIAREEELILNLVNIKKEDPSKDIANFVEENFYRLI